MIYTSRFKFFIIVMCVCLYSVPCFSQEVDKEKRIDEKVGKFLESWKNRWRDLNVPESDGQKLYTIIIENDYTKALEIGTSTGHSAIWIAWALSKTGGKLITIEIDRRRYNQAMENFKEAGLSDYIDARLADAHELVPQLEGPFDFVFIDADKDWYPNYAKAVVPKLEAGGCITAHNMSRREAWVVEYLDYMESIPDMETSIVRVSSAGLSVSYKKEEK